MIVAIDGPAGAGKSTVARCVARRLGLFYLDTGAMYRAIAWKALQSGVPLEDEIALSQLADQCTISFEENGERVFLDGSEVTEEIRRPEVGKASSAIAKLSGVRRALVRRQQALGRQGGLVAEGRDMTTVVFPEAEVKIYLDASDETRARRRWLELKERNLEIPFERVLAEVRARDVQDSTRADSPLRVAEDAVVVDTTDLGIDEVVERILKLARCEDLS